jgi:KDO2-lipid IV(A) lauroyltransferase
MSRYRFMLLLSWIAARAPRAFTYLLAMVTAEIACHFNDRARLVAAANMRRVLGPDAHPATIRRAVRGCFRAACYYYADLGRYPLMDPARFLQNNVRTVGFEHVEHAIKARKGVIMAAMHYGNPEYTAQAMIGRGYNFYALTEPIEPLPLADLYTRLRSSQGNTFLPVGRQGLKAVIRHLRAGGVVCIMADRDIQHGGEEVMFCGARARIPSGAVDLARHTGAALIPSIAHRHGWDRFTLYTEAPITLVNTGRTDADRRLNTERLIQRFEPYLRRDPAQWFVLEEPVWSEDQRRLARWTAHRAERGGRPAILADDGNSGPASSHGAR